jgi:hypothetical protein
MTMVAMDAEKASDGSPSPRLRTAQGQEDRAAVEHQPATARGMSKEQFDQRMAAPAAKAAVAKVKARHARMDGLKRRGLLSDKAEARTSKFPVTPDLAQSYQARHADPNSPQRRMGISDMVTHLRRAADVLHAAGLLHPGLDPEDAAGLRSGAGERAALGNTITTGPNAYQQERQASRAAASGNAGRSGDTWSSASGI